MLPMCREAQYAFLNQNRGFKIYMRLPWAPYDVNDVAQIGCRHRLSATAGNQLLWQNGSKL